MGRSSLSEELPTDVVFDIISRTKSLKTLDACKLVCKEWKQMIHDPSFMPLYCQNTKNLYGYFVQDIRNCNYVSMFVCLNNNNYNNNKPVLRMPENTRILASCNQGILCCVKKRDYNNYQYCVCKPATQQWQDLPNPQLLDYTTVSVAIIVLRSTPLRYKIVRLLRDGIINEPEYCTYHCEIFDSEAWAWRKIQDVKLPYPELIHDSAPSVTIGNSIHWLTSENNILKLQVIDEYFNVFTLPEQLYNDNSNRSSKKLVEYEGRLGLVCTTEEEGNNNSIEVWLTEEEENDPMINWRNIGESVPERYANAAGLYNAGIVFLKAAYEVVFYKIQDGSLMNKVVLDKLRDAREIFQFRSDFEHVDLQRIH